MGRIVKYGYGSLGVEPISGKGKVLVLVGCFILVTTPLTKAT